MATTAAVLSHPSKAQHAHQSPLINRILRIKPITARYGMAQSTVYAAAKNGEFPPPIKLGERISGWLESEVDAVINARIRGESTEQIKELVKSLVAARQTVGGAV